MEIVNLLEFLNNTRGLYTLNYSRCDRQLMNFLDLMTEDEQFTQSIDLGLIFVSQRDADKYTIVDGMGRILSLSLLLHAICECYKKTSVQNDKAIKTIRSKYLTRAKGYKLILNEKDNEIYSKILNGERLSGHEKKSHMFELLHNFWAQIKEEKLQAAKIFTMLKKINVTLVDTDDISKRDLYYKLNSHRQLNQMLLIDDYMKEKGLLDEWENIKTTGFIQDDDILLFFKDFFITKFNYKSYKEERLYESFVNFFETMQQYVPKETLISRIKRSAALYSNMLNINFNNEEIRQAFVNIKRHGGEDTYANILSVYEDYYSNNISESIFLEILNTIDEYLINRQNTGKDIDFNELIQYLNAFITCK